LPKFSGGCYSAICCAPRDCVTPLSQFAFGADRLRTPILSHKCRAARRNLLPDFYATPSFAVRVALAPCSAARLIHNFCGYLAVACAHVSAPGDKGGSDSLSTELSQNGNAAPLKWPPVASAMFIPRGI
jgi:hypothetical protein